jgi:uncharacterized membrane protein
MGKLTRGINLHWRTFHWHAVDFLMFLMIIGPLIAPHFEKMDNPLNRNTAALIYAIGAFVCPQPEYAWDYGGKLYAICFRCVAAVGGLLVARALHAYSQRARDMSLRSRLLFLLATVTWLTIDVHFTHWGIWEANLPLMWLHGLIYGTSVGFVAAWLLMALDRGITRMFPPRRMTLRVS